MSKTSKTCSKLIKTLKNQQCDRRTNEPTDGRTDRPTDRVTYRVACTQLKTAKNLGLHKERISHGIIDNLLNRDKKNHKES